MLPTFASLFSGGGGADQGARQAGLLHSWGIELKEAYALIARANGFKVTTQDVLETEWAALTAPDWLHASPPCQRASVANVKGGECQLDRLLADAVINAIAHLNPKYFSLENVRGYQKFQSFNRIEGALLSAGYKLAIGVLDAADYGVPQNRKRLWLVASRVGPAILPIATHHNPRQQPNLFTKPWVSWSDSLRDVETARFGVMSDRMTKMLPSDLPKPCLVTGFKNGGFERNLTIRSSDQPSPTLLASMSRESLQPWLIDGAMTRVLDVPQIAALQSFPARYRWGDNPTRAREAIGNSVAPLMMQKIVEAIVPAQVRRVG
jgi:DNA (cytosine-5)-methyltransferase 1